MATCCVGLCIVCFQARRTTAPQARSLFQYVEDREPRIAWTQPGDEPAMVALPAATCSAPPAAAVAARCYRSAPAAASRTPASGGWRVSARFRRALPLRLAFALYAALAAAATGSPSPPAGRQKPLRLLLFHLPSTA
eukprot:scaffold24474_cov127-Isochrysis_galbana.AAC.1